MKKYREKTLGHRTKAEKAQRKAIFEGLSDYEDLKLTPPGWLNDTAKQVYKQIVEASKPGDFKEIDLPLVSAYAATYARMLAASAAADEAGLVSSRGHINIFLRIFNQEAKQLVQISNALGVNPSARTRNAFRKAPTQKPKDKFLDTMKDPDYEKDPMIF